MPIAHDKFILSQAQMKREILASHRRSMQYGISREDRNPDQVKLTPGQLEARSVQNREFIDVASEYIDEFYELLSPDRFMTAIVDREGYILQFSGSAAIKSEFSERNCAPGFRWTEKDVGTTAISLSLEKKVPVQLNDKDHFCKRAHGFTSSAAPIFADGEQLQGVLVVSGKSTLVHPHTLVMVIAAARSIEKQIRLLNQNKQMTVYAGFLHNVLESAETGLLTLDQASRIWKANRKAKRILGQEDLDGKPSSVLAGLEVDLLDVYQRPEAWKAKQGHIRQHKKDIHIVYSAQPVLSDQGNLLGAVLVFEEFGNIRKIADKISSGNAYFTFDHLIGDSPAFRKAVDLARRASESKSTVLLLGETGTGKELFAQAIHNAGPLRTRPFIPINCGAIPGELMESELFGYVDGAFSGALKGGRPGKFELAAEGTILLDEIGDMPHNMQVKLLRVLQTGEIQRIGDSKVLKVNTRVIAATNVDLTEAIQQNRFRQDLYYRLNILSIAIPPLRERGIQDIQALANYFVNKYNPGCRLSSDAIEALAAYDWPGNVRELENSIQRALHTCYGKKLNPEDLCLPSKAGLARGTRTGTLRDMERAMIVSTLESTGFNMAETAKILGISRATLYRKVKAYAIKIEAIERGG
jgi:transcriptional regulator of acetoin/glycerol metabolism